MESIIKTMRKLAADLSSSGNDVVCIIATKSQKSDQLVPENVAKIAASMEPRSTSRYRSITGSKYSRLNFEKNLLKLAAQQVEKNSDGWFTFEEISSQVAKILDITLKTAKEHVRKAYVLNILSRMESGKTIFYRLYPKETPTIKFDEDDANTVDIPS